MWFNKSKVKKVADTSEIKLLQSDSPFERTFKMMQAAGFANPNRIGAVDAMSSVLYQYMVMDGVIKQAPLTTKEDEDV